MLLHNHIISSLARPIRLSLHFCHFRSKSRSYCVVSEMGRQVLQSKTKKLANFRLCNVSSYATEILEIIAEKPVFHALVIPGNPGAVLFYKEFVESLYEWLGGSVSVTAVGHISHTKKDSERGRLFSLQEQIDHKIDFIKHELQNKQVPIILVGHSIGAYMCIEMFKRNQEQVLYYIGLYPFLALDLQSQKQSIIGKIAAAHVRTVFVLIIFPTSLLLLSNGCLYGTQLGLVGASTRPMSPVVSVVLSSIVASLGFLPSWALRLIVSKSVGKSWSSTAVEVTCSHLTKARILNLLFFYFFLSKLAIVCGLSTIYNEGSYSLCMHVIRKFYVGNLQFHTMRNVLFMAMTEFKKLSETPDWTFMREKHHRIAFLFGIDDHWGPLQMYEEISRQVPDISLSLEREGHTHAFSCTEVGSTWVAHHVANLIKNQISSSTH
ncbi:hypothetical protein G4B88_010269 [Cannabis sativa]|uniref:Lipid droplet-associated hydrolase n=1 Tax=Cannabis sativa TaxID=3483 RepID=A0A7J6I5I4_CANSA|nr:hypothetical protein G4B88_010269 [Cannabis sativa]